jgi:hypothetical protein
MQLPSAETPLADDRTLEDKCLRFILNHMGKIYLLVLIAGVAAIVVRNQWL